VEEWYLVEGEEAAGSGELAGFSRSVGFGVEAAVARVRQAEALAIEGHPHDQFRRRSPLLDPVVEGEVLREKT
jgi:hypothetical protein